ncbi:VOC family protein [Nocardioides solisilvae]|uniref:VOC family protein n=1 Tax=Nocardioides solisilvae TaxID=1542435 RepID=UPI0019507C1B|nr:VOC family protein [Nocardioides solisilvae]
MLAPTGACLDLGQGPDEGHVVLADPDGNLLCVLEPGNGFTHGCGLLGELTCEGGREVGLFWAAALGWPLVWDEGAQTAVQSPHGGTKVSWDGPSLESDPGTPRVVHGRHRLRRTLPAGARLAPEVDRLVALGARPLAHAHDRRVELADPDGHVLLVEGAA